MRYTLPILSFGFYGQIYLLFTSVFYCRKDETPTSPYLKCRDTWFNKMKPLVGLAMGLHFLISFITNTLYYQPTFIKCKTDLLQKSNSVPDVVFLFSKVIIISIFIMDKGVEKEHWAIICFLILVTGLNTYFTLFYQSRKNKIMRNLNNIFCLILFSGFIILLIGKIVIHWNFNGLIFLLTSLIAIHLIFFVFYKSFSLDFLLIDIKTIINPDRYLQYVLKFSEFVRNKNRSREYLIVITGLISSMEEHCIDPECPLKKYLVNLKKGIDSEYYLLQFVEILYQYGITKFPANIFLKNYYSSFLIMEMNNKKKAVIVINDIKNKIVSLQMNYSIYRCVKIIENYSSPFINKNNSIFNYRKDVQDFKNNIENISLLYYDFLSLLLGKKMDNANNLEKINKIGYTIKKLLKKTEKSFDKLINIKIDNYEIIKLYSEFAENILNDEDKIEKCKNFLKIKNNNNITEIQEKDYSNFNLEILKKNDDFFYLIILTKNKDLGIISDCSKNLCNLLGYTKSELLGKHINFLLPKIFHERHTNIIKQKSEEHKLNFFEKLYTNSIYSPDFIEKDIYCISKSKLIIPLTMKIYLVNNEENELVYIAEFTRVLTFMNDLYKRINNYQSQKYCVLTDKNFIIQSFTASCLKFLKFKYEDIGANLNILNFIKQFRKDYISAINASTGNKYSNLSNTGILSVRESFKLKTGFRNSARSIMNPINNNNKNVANDIKRMKLKNDIFNKKYSKKCRITWCHCSDDSINSSSVLQKYHHIRNSLINDDSILSFDEFKVLNNYEMDLYMEAKSIILENELIGYYFYFNKLYFSNFNDFFNYKIENRISNIDQKNEAVKKSKKYEVTIKSKGYLSAQKKSEKQVMKNLENTGYLKFKSDRIDYTKIKFKRKSAVENKSKFKRKSSKTFITKDLNKELNENILESSTQEDLVINGDFVPINPFFLDFDHNEGSYLTSTKFTTEKLKEVQKEAEEKMNKIIKIKIEKTRIIQKIFNETDSEEEESKEEFQDKSSSIFSSSNSDFKTEKFSPKTSIISKQNSKKKFRGDRRLQNINLNIEDIGNIFLGRNKEEIKKILRRTSISIPEGDIDYYHFHNIDIRKVKLLVYNYQREMVEEKSHIYFTEIENIIHNLKNDIKVDIGRDEDYPNVVIKNKNKDIKKEENGKEQRKSSNDEYDFGVMNKDKILKRKIVEAINNYKDEIPVKNLKILILISCVIMYGFGLLNFYFNWKYFATFQELINLIQSSLGLQYCNLASLFYMRELILLNFNLSNIKGGLYTGFPAINREQYSSFISEKLTSLYIDNHALVKNVLGTAYPFSKNSSYYLTEEIFNIKFLTSNNDILIVKYDMKKIIIAYNTAFSNLVSTSGLLEQNHDDVINYFMNSFNEFEKSFDTLYDVFNYELELLKKEIKTYIYLIVSFVFVVYTLIYILAIKYFISSNIIRINYIKIFYNISSKTLRGLMTNCLILIDKFKYLEMIDKNRSEDEDDEKENITLKNRIQFNDTFEISSADKEINQKNQSIIFSFFSLFFILFFFIFVYFLFSYFIYISDYFYDLYKKSLKISKFSRDFSVFQYCPMKIYNAYREYLFDNISMISNFNPYEYLRNAEKVLYNSIHLSRKYANPIIGEMIKSNSSIIQLFRKNFCSFEVVEYFNITNECIKKLGYLSRLNLDKGVLYFLEELRLKKNVIKYFLDNYNVVGNLTEYNKDNMIKVYNENSNNNKTIFRLELFNNETIHSNINFMYFYIFLQNVEESKFIINLYTINGKNSHFILLIIMYILSTSIIYIIFFIPMVKFLNKQIYKAKNILSIVPINALLYQKSNRNLFKFFND